MSATNDPNISPQEKADKTPPWLLKLEEESWQAELVISGAAIFGCILLPGLISELEGWVLYTANREGMLLWYFIFMFANMLAYILIITFVLHFVLRALWIGMIGFNSAYPEGYKPNDKYSKHFQEQLIEEYGDTYGYIKQLDRTCSTIFGAGFSIVLVSLGYMLIITVLGVLSYLLSNYLPSGSGIVLLIVLFASLMLFMVFNGILLTKRYRDTDFARRYHYKMVSGFGKIFMNIGNRPASYIMNVLTSQNIDKKGGGVKTMLVSSLVGMIGAGLGVSNMNTRAFMDDVYHRDFNDVYAVRTAFYADREMEGYVYHPVIPSQELHPGDLFTVFLPLPNREKFEQEKQCEVPEVPMELSDEARQKRRARAVACARAYYRFYLNDKEITDFDLVRHWYGSARQYGFLATFFDLNLQSGKNILKVESNYFNDAGEPRVALVPFYFMDE